MSQTSKALKREEDEARGRQVAAEHPGDGWEPPEIAWGLTGRCLVEYERACVWLANAGSRGRRVRTVMVVSCRPGSGTTTTAALLAVTLAQGGKLRVLIVDGNLRTPTLNRVFNVGSDGGLFEVLSEGTVAEPRIQPTSRPNLSVLPSGRIPISPVAVCDGEAIDGLIAQLRQKFDYVIFDAAPVLEFPDAYALAPKVDGVILVVGAEKTVVHEAQLAKRNLELAGGYLLGVVLNRGQDYTPRILRRLFGSAS